MTQTMTLSITNEPRRPAPHVVAAGIVAAIVVSMCCLMILSHAS